MDALALINHALNFFAPAWFLALMLPLAGRLFARRKQLGLFRQMSLQMVLGSLTLGAGLFFLGNDGRMLTYASLVLVCASAQFVITRR
jgi:hypothetical protein